VTHAGVAARVLRQEALPDRVLPRLRQVDAEARALLEEERVGELDQDPGPVAGLLLRASGPAVVEVAQDLQTLAYDLVRADVLEIGDEPDATGVIPSPTGFRSFARSLSRSRAATDPAPRLWDTPRACGDPAKIENARVHVKL